MKNRRPFSSCQSQSQTNIKKNNTKKKLRIMTACLSASELHLSNNNKYNSKNSFKKSLSRPNTSLSSKITKLNLFSKSKSNSELDALSLIIDSNPNQYNSIKITEKMKKINSLFSRGSEENLSRPRLSENTYEIFYKYNLLYGSNSQNLITTYSPKMSPMSVSINGFVKKMNFNLHEKLYVFSEEEILELLNARCKDIGIEPRENMLYKFRDFCNSKCKNRTIDLSDNHLGLNSIKFLSNILYNTDRIYKINLSKNNLGDRGVEILINSIKNSISLVSLNIMSNSISHKGGQLIFKILSKQQSIIDLNLSSCEGINRNRLTSIGIQNIEKYLKTNFFIENLNIAGNSIKNEGFHLLCKGINGNNFLKYLNISNNDINEKGIKNFLHIIKKTKLKSLNISNNPIKSEGLINITNSLRYFPDLKIFICSNCNIDFEGFNYLLKVLQTVRRIDTLDVSQNNLHSENYDDLKQSFCSFGIKFLNMTGCQLGDKGGHIMGECLTLNETIKNINLSKNKITDIGFKSFISLFTTNNTIENLDLSSNFISDLTAVDFIDNLQFNTTLKKINLFDNELRNLIGTKIIDILDVNKTILHINLLFNRVTVKTIDEINKKLKVNMEKEKARYVPNLIKYINEMQFDTEQFNILANEIKAKKKQLNFLYKKIKEEIKMYGKSLDKEKNILEDKNSELSKILNEIKDYEKEISKVDKTIKSNDENTKKILRRLKDEISDINQIFDKIENKNLSLKADYEISKQEMQEIYNKTEKELQEIVENITNLQTDFEKTNNEVNEKNNFYQKIINPSYLKDKEVMKKNIYKKRSSIKNSLKLTKVSNNIHDIKNIINTNNNMSSPKDYTMSTSPTSNMNVNIISEKKDKENNKNKKSNKLNSSNKKSTEKNTKVKK